MKFIFIPEPSEYQPERLICKTLLGYNRNTGEVTVCGNPLSACPEHNKEGYAEIVNGASGDAEGSITPFE